MTLKALYSTVLHSHTFIQCIYVQHILYEKGQLGVQYLGQGHFGMGKTGIKPLTFWLEDDRSNP